MSGVLHPVGPEPAQTYWARRAVVIAALVLALALVVAGVVSLARAGSATAAQPPGGPQPAPASSGASTGAGDAFTQSPEPEPSVPGPNATARQSAAPKSPSPKSSSPAATTAALPTCEPASLRPTLTGSPRLEVKKATSFELSLINGSKQTCTLIVSSKNFELTIHSGTDRIWSTADCGTSVKKLTKKLRSEQDLTWKVTWNGRRSAAECKQRPEIPAPGTYVATATFEGAEPVQLRVILHD